MPTGLARIKLGLAIIAIILFAAGIRLDDARLRWIGIGCFAAAWLLRFFKPRARDDPPLE